MNTTSNNTPDTASNFIDQCDAALTLSQRLQLLKAEQDARFALTPVGQELQRFQTNQRIGQMYAQSTLVPDTYKGIVANCAIAVDMAMRMQANPLMVMQNLYIVHGNPSWSSKFLIATVNTCGRYETLKYRFEIDGKIGKHDYYENEWRINPTSGKKEKSRVKKTFDGSKIDNIVCVAYTTEKGSDVVLESVPIDCRLAVTEGWWTKNESKWPSMTRLMLTYRAAAFWVKTYAPELSMGFNTVEESLDIIDTEYEDLSEHTPTVNALASIAQLAKQNARKMAASGYSKQPAEIDPNNEIQESQPNIDTQTTEIADEHYNSETGELLFNS